MSNFQNPSLVAEVRRLILGTFEVSEQEAQDNASGLVILAEGWGSPETAPQLDWAYRVKKSLGNTLVWKSEAEHEKFKADLESGYKAYESYIQNSKRPNSPSA